MPHYDLYDSLGLPKHASSPEILDDLHTRLSNGRFDNYGGEKEVRLACEVLGNPQKRQLYDARLEDPDVPDISVDDLRALFNLRLTERPAEAVASPAPALPPQHPVTAVFPAQTSPGRPSAPQPVTGTPKAQSSPVVPVAIIALLSTALVALAVYAFGWGPGRSSASSADASGGGTETATVTATVTSMAESPDHSTALSTASAPPTETSPFGNSTSVNNSGVRRGNDLIPATPEDSARSGLTALGWDYSPVTQCGSGERLSYAARGVDSYVTVCENAEALIYRSDIFDGTLAAEVDQSRSRPSSGEFVVPVSPATISISGGILSVSENGVTTNSHHFDYSWIIE